MVTILLVWIGVAIWNRLYDNFFKSLWILKWIFLLLLYALYIVLFPVIRPIKFIWGKLSKMENNKFWRLIIVFTGFIVVIFVAMVW